MVLLSVIILELISMGYSKPNSPQLSRFLALASYLDISSSQGNNRNEFLRSNASTSSFSGRSGLGAEPSGPMQSTPMQSAPSSRAHSKASHASSSSVQESSQAPFPWRVGYPELPYTCWLIRWAAFCPSTTILCL